MIETITRLALAALVITFTWAAVAKVLNLSGWKQALDSYRLPRPVRAVSVVAVPMVELVPGALVFARRPAAAGAVGLALVAIFSLALVRAKRSSDGRLPCGCFGQTKERDVGALLARNALLASVAAVVLVNARSDAVFPSSSIEFVPIGLIVLGFGLMWWMATQAMSQLRGK